ncbi:MAG: peptidoglycan editing factor PgeF [Gammaproteobacteria bacterium]|nr:peptidoglycan editing factor PgeF [Gammaproteobacteria bacterium]
MTIHTEFITADWPAPTRVKAYSTLRHSGVSQTPRTELNQQRLIELFKLPEPPTWIQQTHSVIPAEALQANQNKEADAVFTHQTNKVCAVVTADCLPVLLSTSTGSHVAAIHAGWRGLLNGIIENTLDALHLPTDDILVWLGPAIGPKQFEIRKDVYDAFIQVDAQNTQAFTEIGHEHWLADIYLLARLRLQKRGIHKIYGGNHCTYREDENFFSYRREGQATGRNVSLIWIEDSIIKL